VLSPVVPPIFFELITVKHGSRRDMATLRFHTDWYISSHVQGVLELPPREDAPVGFNAVGVEIPTR
jgi:hypothetical protein